jgi:hypothetical protein
VFRRTVRTGKYFPQATTSFLNVLLGEFARGVERENRQFTRKGGIKISGQDINYLLTMAPE